MPLQKNPDTSRVLIIGNSQVGALVASIRTNKDIALFAAPGRRFKDITVDETGELKGAEFSLNCHDPCTVTDFSKIFIYADFPEPVSFVLENTKPYSSGFLTAYYRSKFEHTHSFDLASQISAYCDPAIISLIPRNLSIEEDAGGYRTIDMAKAHAEISAQVGYDIAQVKGAIYTDIHAPDSKYFKQSLRIDGTMVDPLLKPNHARRHVSGQAGVILYNNILRSIDRMSPHQSLFRRLSS